MVVRCGTNKIGPFGEISGQSNRQNKNTFCIRNDCSKWNYSLWTNQIQCNLFLKFKINPTYIKHRTGIQFIGADLNARITAMSRYISPGNHCIKSNKNDRKKIEKDFFHHDEYIASQRVPLARKT